MIFVTFPLLIQPVLPTIQEVQSFRSSSPSIGSSGISSSSSASTPLSLSPASASTGGSSVQISVALERAPVSGQPGLISVSVSPELANSPKGFSFELDPKVIGQVAPTEVKAVQMDGTPLPKWIHYESETKSFVAQSVPDGGLPLQIKVIAGSSDSVVVIQENAGNLN